MRMPERAKVPAIRFKGFTDAWEERKLGEISKTTIGEFVIKTKQSDESPYPVYNGGRSYTGKYDEYNNDGPKIVISARGANAGFVNYVSGRYWAGNSCYSVSVTKEDEFSIGYLYQFIKYNQVLFTAYQQAANIPSVSKSDVEKFSIKYPTVLEQKKIESFFKQLDNTIALHQRKLLKLKNVKKAMLEKMFPKNGSTVPEIRFAGFTDAWEQRKLGELGSVVMNRRIFKEQTSDHGDVPFYKIGTFGSEPDAFISRQLFEEYKSKYPYPKAGDILISASGSIGRTVEYTGEDEYFQDSNIVWLQHDDRLVNSFLKQFYSVVKWSGLEGSTIKRLYNKNILDTPISLPKPEEQKKIGHFFIELDKLITLHQRKLELLKVTKKSLLQKMFPKDGESVPEIRFAGFTDDWEQRKLGDYIIPYNEVTTKNNQYPVFTSSRKGLFFQTDYYDGNQIASEDNTGYNIVPRGYFTYRHMSDDLVFKFNINNLADNGIVSTLYPVFTTTKSLDSKYLQYQLNDGEEFKRFAILQKQGGSRTYMYLSKLKDMILTMPILDEQIKISTFFRQLDDTITLHQRELDLLKDLKKSMLQQMFI